MSSAAREALKVPYIDIRAFKMGEVTQIISSIRSGEDDGNGTEKLFAIVYEQLRIMARKAIRDDNINLTLQPTSLVNEAFLKLARAEDIQWQDRIHFFRAASQAMRRILVDKARERKSIKRGGNLKRNPMADALESVEDEGLPHELDQILDLEEALQRLGQDAPDRAELVQLHFFAGLNLKQCSELLGVSLSTTERQWRATKAWLRKEMG